MSSPLFLNRSILLIVAHEDSMISTSAVVVKRMSIAAPVSIAAIFIIGVKNDLRGSHPPHLLTAVIIELIENKWAIYWHENWPVDISIGSAAILDSGVAIVVTFRQWAICIVSVTVILVIPVKLTLMETK